MLHLKRLVLFLIACSLKHAQQILGLNARLWFVPVHLGQWWGACTVIQLVWAKVTIAGGGAVRGGRRAGLAVAEEEPERRNMLPMFVHEQE